jgi:hypothetical protein
VKLLRFAGAALVAFAVLGATTDAHAQSWKVGGTAQIATGLEGNGQENGTPRVARTRLRLGADLHVDEFPDEIFAAGLLVDVSPRAAFGVDLRYVRRLGEKFEVNIGGIGYFEPATLFGPSADFIYRLPLSSGTAFTIGPEVNVFVAGSDLPDGTIIWQGLLQLGIHANL